MLQNKKPRETTLANISVLQGIQRLPDDTNRDLKAKIINLWRFKENTTRQGMVNAISNALGYDQYNIKTRRIFYLSRDPSGGAISTTGVTGTDNSGCSSKDKVLVDTSRNFNTVGVVAGYTVTNTADWSAGTVTEIYDTLVFVSGSAEPSIGDLIVGAGSTAHGIVEGVYLLDTSGGSWAGGDAAGIIILSSVVGVFQGENINNTTTAAGNVLTSSGAQSTGSALVCSVGFTGGYDSQSDNGDTYSVAPSTPFTVTVDNVVQTQITEDQYPTATTGYVVWKDLRGNYTRILEFIDPPAYARRSVSRTHDGSYIEILYDYEVLDEDTGRYVTKYQLDKCNPYDIEDESYMGYAPETEGSIGVYPLNDKVWIDNPVNLMKNADGTPTGKLWAIYTTVDRLVPTSWGA
jgi:hypothetical protein